MGNSTGQKLKKIPFGYTPEEIARRKEIFDQFDMNSNGYLSLAEVDKGVRDVLDLPELFDIKPVLIRAFVAARTKLTSKNSHGDDYVSKAEFIYLLIYLRQYYEYWVDFDAIDTSGDRRIGQSQFVKAAPLMKKWGVKITDAHLSFEKLKNKVGAKENVTFAQFCDWAIAKHLKLYSNIEDHNAF